MKKLAVTTLICIGLSGLVAQAALVHYSFDETVSGTWEVSVQVTADGNGDAAGLSAYGMWVYNTAGVSYAENTLYDPGSFKGFSPPNLTTMYMNSPDPGDADDDFNAGSFQNFGTYALLGVGKVVVSQGAVSLGVPALLGTLTTPAGLGAADFGPDGAGLINVGNTNFVPAGEITITHEVNVIPEPMTMAVLGLGGLAVLIRRRRQ